MCKSKSKKTETGTHEAKPKKKLDKKQKKIILICISVFLVVAILATSLSLYFVYRSKGPFSGTVKDQSGAPIENVMVTDGRNVVKTDAEGKFELKGYYNSTFVTVTIPSGYNADQFYIPVKKETETYDFELTKIDADYSNGYSFLQVSDTEINSPIEGGWLDHVKGLVEDLDPAFLIHTGDICYENGLKQHIIDMNSENMGLPVRYVIGNHDYVKWGKYGEALYESLYGPVWYSFDVGNVHYVVTPFQSGADEPSGYNKNDRWKWLANDLANIDPNMKVVMFNHTIPPSDDFVISYGTKKLDLKKHNLIAWIYGHYHDNIIENVNGVLKISTSRPDSGGIDSSVSGTRQINIDANGAMNTEMHYFDFDAPNTAPDSVWSNEELKGNVLFSDTLLEGNTVYVGTSDDDYPRECGVYAVDAENGSTKWFYKTVNSVKNRLVYQNGKIVAQDAEGNVYCLNAANGDLIWQDKVGLGASITTSSGIVFDGENVYLGCASEVTVLKLSDGSEVWSKKLKIGESSPADFVIVGNKLLVNSHWNALVAFDKNTGKKLWENDDKDLRFRSSTPAVIDDNTVIVADSDVIMVVDLNKGTIKSKKYFKNEEDKSIYNFNSSSQPYVKNGIAYIATSNKGVIAYDYNKEKIVWTLETGRSLVYTAPYTSGNSATVESSFVEKDGCLVFGANDGYLYKVSMGDGTVVTKINVGAPIFGKAALTSNGDVIVSDFAGRMFRITI